MVCLKASRCTVRRPVQATFAVCDVCKISQDCVYSNTQQGINTGKPSVHVAGHGLRDGDIYLRF